VIILPRRRLYRQQYHPPAQPRSERDILLVDNFAPAPKLTGQSPQPRRRRIPPTTWTSANFRAASKPATFETAKVRAILHQGACRTR